MEPQQIKPSIKPNHFEIHIEKLVEGGMGMGRFKGQIVFVPWTLPGEKVEVKATGRHKGFIQAHPIGFLSSSTKRVQPPCLLFKKCGGCQFQHLDPEIESSEKLAIFKETLQRIGKIDSPLIAPVISSPKPFFYRNRCQLRVLFQNGKNLLGFNEFQTHRLVPINDCLLLEPLLNETVRHLSHILVGDLALPNLRRIHIQSSGGKNLLLTLFGVGTFPFPLNRLFQTLQGVLPLKGMVAYSASGRKTFGAECLFHRLGNLSLRVGDRTFSQVHWDLNHTIVETLIQWLTPLKGKKILDLYSGMGNFTLPLSEQGAEGIGLDENPYAIKDGIENTKHNKVEGCRFYTTNLRRGLPKHLLMPNRFDALLVDPPREGLSQNLLKDILTLSPAKLIYVSCSTPTLARDLMALTQKDYQIKEIQPIDLFPQTSHLETLAHLIRRK